MIHFKRIGQKNVYVVQSHHEALEAWAEVRRSLDAAPDLISLDEHTDTLEPFLSYVANLHDVGERSDEEDAVARQALLEQIDFRDKAKVGEAISRLRHDEHIQAATRSGIIDIAFVFSIEGAQTLSEEEQQQQDDFKLGEKPPPLPDRPHRYHLPKSRIFTIPFGCHIGCATSDHDADCHRSLSDQILESCILKSQIEIASKMSESVRGVPLCTKPYILDLDLDIFHTYHSLAPDDAAVFHELISGSLGVTIAVERECTDSLWLENSGAPIDHMLNSLYGHIEKASSRSA